MTQTRPVNDPAAMADILASIRRIVAEEDRKFERSPLRPPESGEVLVLTPAMRIDTRPDRAAAAPETAVPRPAPAEAGAPAAVPASPPPFAPKVAAPAASAVAEDARPSPAGSPGAVQLSADEAAMVEIARAVFHEEVERIGAEALAPLIRDMVREEIENAFDKRG